MRCQRGWLLLMAALLAGGLSALALSGALAAPRAGFLRLATNLSASPNRPSYYADIAASPDGDRVVVVWPELYTDEAGVRRGPVYLRWASESTGSGWSEPVAVHPVSGERALWAAVAVTGTGPYTAHVAYIVEQTSGSSIFHFIRYRTCTLGGSCSGPQNVVTRSLVTKDPGFGSVDIALDDEGVPYFVYVDYQWSQAQAGDVGTVYYLRHREIPQRVSGSDQNAHTPAIAWNGGAVHIIWVTEPLPGQWDYYLYYWRSGTSSPLVKQLISYAPHNPAIAVFSNTVLVVWDMNNAWKDPDCGSDQTKCDLYTLAYIRSTNNGETWPRQSGVPLWYELRGDPLGTDWPYTSTGQVVEYTRFLRPSVGFRADGKPVVVWHVNDGTTTNPDYNIYYTEALTVPEDAADPIEWAEIRRFGQNPAGDSGSPVVAPLLPPDALHVVYIQKSGDDRETYYDGNEYENYPHIYLPIVMRNSR